VVTRQAQTAVSQTSRDSQQASQHASDWFQRRVTDATQRKTFSSFTELHHAVKETAKSEDLHAAGPAFAFDPPTEKDVSFS
jgi:hypothetical protein